MSDMPMVSPFDNAHAAERLLCDLPELADRCVEIVEQITRVSGDQKQREPSVISESY